MKCKGYRLNGYDATYTKTTFNIVEQENRVLEITDLEGGIAFVVEFDSAMEQNRRTSGWHNGEAKGQGTSISFGSKGLFEQLIYEGKKCKINKDGGAE